MEERARPGPPGPMLQQAGEAHVQAVSAGCRGQQWRCRQNQRSPGHQRCHNKQNTIAGTKEGGGRKRLQQVRMRGGGSIQHLECLTPTTEARASVGAWFSPAQQSLRDYQPVGNERDHRPVNEQRRGSGVRDFVQTTFAGGNRDSTRTCTPGRLTARNLRCSTYTRYRIYVSKIRSGFRTWGRDGAGNGCAAERVQVAAAGGAVHVVHILVLQRAAESTVSAAGRWHEQD